MVNPNKTCIFARNYEIMAKKNTSKPAKRKKESDDFIELKICVGNSIGYGCDPSYKTYKEDIPMSYRTKAKACKKKVKSD